MPERSNSLRFTQKLVKGFARAVLHIFFREIRLEGAEKIPRQGPLFYVMNHPNGLLDPALVMMMPRYPRFLARHGIWKNWIMRPFLDMTGTIPVYRRMDPDADVSRNIEAFEACYEALADGGVIGIFPEGMSHSAPSMVPVKTGMARILLGAEEKHGRIGIRIVPIGLMFDAKDRFRSRVLVRAGEPIDPILELDRAKEDSRGARHALTRKVDGALREVTLNYHSWNEARLIERAADLFARSSADLPESLDISDQFNLRYEFSQGYEVMKEKYPDRVARLAREVEVYDRMLRFTGFRDENIISDYKKGRIVEYLLKTLSRLLIYFPLAVVGTILNRPPYKVTRWLAMPYEAHPEKPASKKLLGAFVVYPAFWIFWAWLAGKLFGGRAAFWTALIAPFSGYVALRFHEERRTFLKESYAYLRLRTRKRFWDELRARRRSLSKQVAKLTEEYLETRKGNRE